MEAPVNRVTFKDGVGVRTQELGDSWLKLHCRTVIEAKVLGERRVVKGFTGPRFVILKIAGSSGNPSLSNTLKHFNSKSAPTLFF
jgi:hypothetical protein